MNGPVTAAGIGLEYQFEYHWDPHPQAPVEVGPGPYGTRLFFEATEASSPRSVCPDGC